MEIVQQIANWNENDKNALVCSVVVVDASLQKDWLFAYCCIGLSYREDRVIEVALLAFLNLFWFNGLWFYWKKSTGKTFSIVNSRHMFWFNWSLIPVKIQWGKPFKNTSSLKGKSVNCAQTKKCYISFLHTFYVFIGTFISKSHFQWHVHTICSMPILKKIKSLFIWRIEKN